jgi:hypothetical protein
VPDPADLVADLEALRVLLDRWAGVRQPGASDRLLELARGEVAELRDAAERREPDRVRRLVPTLQRRAAWLRDAAGQLDEAGRAMGALQCRVRDGIGELAGRVGGRTLAAQAVEDAANPVPAALLGRAAEIGDVVEAAEAVLMAVGPHQRHAAFLDESAILGEQLHLARLVLAGDRLASRAQVAQGAALVELTAAAVRDHLDAVAWAADDDRTVAEDRLAGVPGVVAGLRRLAAGTPAPAPPALPPAATCAPMVPGLLRAIDPAATEVGGWSFSDRVLPERDGVVAVRTAVVAPDGTRGVVVRWFERATGDVTAAATELDRIAGPRLVPTAVEVVAGGGTPLDLYVTLRQARLVWDAGDGPPLPGHVRVPGVDELSVVLVAAAGVEAGLSLEEAVVRTACGQAAADLVAQLGGRVAAVHVEKGFEMLAGRLTGATPERLAEHGLSPWHRVRVSFHLVLEVEPAGEPAPAPARGAPAGLRAELEELLWQVEQDVAPLLGAMVENRLGDPTVAWLAERLEERAGALDRANARLDEAIARRQPAPAAEAVLAAGDELRAAWLAGEQVARAIGRAGERPRADLDELRRRLGRVEAVPPELLDRFDAVLSPAVVARLAGALDRAHAALRAETRVRGPLDRLRGALAGWPPDDERGLGEREAMEWHRTVLAEARRVFDHAVAHDIPDELASAALTMRWAAGELEPAARRVLPAEERLAAAAGEVRAELAEVEAVLGEATQFPEVARARALLAEREAAAVPAAEMLGEIAEARAALAGVEVPEAPAGAVPSIQVLVSRPDLPEADREEVVFAWPTGSGDEPFTGVLSPADVRGVGLGTCWLLTGTGAAVTWAGDAVAATVRRQRDGSFRVTLREAVQVPGVVTRADGTYRVMSYVPTGRLIELTVLREVPVRRDDPTRPAYAEHRNGAVGVSVLEAAAAGIDRVWSGSRRRWEWHAEGSSGYDRLNRGSTYFSTAEWIAQQIGRATEIRDTSTITGFEAVLRAELAAGRGVVVATGPTGEMPAGVPHSHALLVTGLAGDVVELFDFVAAESRRVAIGPLFQAVGSWVITLTGAEG